MDISKTQDVNLEKVLKYMSYCNQYAMNVCKEPRQCLMKWCAEAHEKGNRKEWEKMIKEYCSTEKDVVEDCLRDSMKIIGGDSYDNPFSENFEKYMESHMETLYFLVPAILCMQGIMNPFVEKRLVSKVSRRVAETFIQSYFKELMDVIRSERIEPYDGDDIFKCEIFSPMKYQAYFKTGAYKVAAFRKVLRACAYYCETDEEFNKMVREGFTKVLQSFKFNYKPAKEEAVGGDKGE